jgi:branched-chain amino acid transport system ATP-binding protein
MLLEVDRLCVRYGHVRAVSEVCLKVARGEIVAVLGANGAGKSSLLHAIIGIVPPDRGRIHFDGAEITGRPPAARVRAGLVLVPEGRRILVSLTVHENLLMGAYAAGNRIDLDREIARIYQRFPNLAQRRDYKASVLSGGEQQMLAIGRALVARPQLMVLDEPSLGLSPLFVNELFVLLEELNRGGTSILLVEQNTRKALQIADRAYLLELGKVIAEGAPDDLTAGGTLVDAYLGQAGNGDRRGMPRTT